MKAQLETLLIFGSESALTGMKRLDENAHRILFVVDSDKRLVGSVTDGDVRRWILSGNSLEDPIERMSNRKPIILPADYDPASLQPLMLENKIECVPIVDSDGVILDAIFWTELFEERPRHLVSGLIDVPVVIMAGGFGTRLKPFTTILPKPLIPIGDQSIVEHIIETFEQAGASQFFLTLNHKARVIKAYFEDIDTTYSLDFVVEDEPLGTAGSLTLLKEDLVGTFIVTNCDIIIRADYAEVLRFHESNNHTITLVSSMMHYQIPYGICEIDKEGTLTGMKEKPELNFLISTGMYVLDSSVFDLMETGSFMHMTHLIDRVREAGGTVGVFPISEKSWDDTGQWEEYTKAVRQLSHD